MATYIERDILENLNLSQLIQEYEIIAEKKTRNSAEEARKLLEVIFSKSKRKEKLVTQLRLTLEKIHE